MNRISKFEKYLPKSKEFNLLQKPKVFKNTYSSRSNQSSRRAFLLPALVTSDQKYTAVAFSLIAGFTTSYWLSSSNIHCEGSDTAEELIYSINPEFEKIRSVDSEINPCYRIVLTGGPCGGKSTALAHISRHLSSLGFKVYLVPEAASLLNTAGAKIHGLSTQEQQICFEESLMQTRMAMEDAIYNIAKNQEVPSVIICDRGSMDSMIYLDKGTWELMLDQNSWSVIQLRDRRYDAIIHMVTTAIGAEKYYSLENNPARTETIEQAQALDIKGLNAWVGHPQLRIIDNSTDFAGKVRRVIEGVCEVVGAPLPPSAERRFVLDSPPVIPEDVHAETFQLEETYLHRSEWTNESKVCKRGQHGSYDYRHTTTKIFEDGRTVTRDRQTGGREYASYLAQKDPNTKIVKKEVTCFMYENQYFVINKYEEPSLTILEVRSESTVSLTIPPFIKVKKEVTGEREYTSSYLARANSVAL